MQLSYSLSSMHCAAFLIGQTLSNSALRFEVADVSTRSVAGWLAHEALLQLHRVCRKPSAADCGRTVEKPYLLHDKPSVSHRCRLTHFAVPRRVHHVQHISRRGVYSPASTVHAVPAREEAQVPVAHRGSYFQQAQRAGRHLWDGGSGPAHLSNPDVLPGVWCEPHVQLHPELHVVGHCCADHRGLW